MGWTVINANGQIKTSTATTNLDWDDVWLDAVHSHQSNAEGGTLDHGLALTGLSDNDHPQYLLVVDIDDTPVNGEVAQPISSNWAFDHVAAADPHAGYRLESADHTHQSTGLQGGQLDHGLALTGLSDNDHPQYLLVTDIDDTPVNGETAQPISSNWAFDHVAAADPHTGYRLESADHTHQSTGAQAGQLDHGLALTGLTDDDHTQYLLASAATDRTTFAANWTDLTDGGATTLHTHAASGEGTVTAEQASTSGTAITFTGIPSGTKLIYVMCAGVSTNAANPLHIQIGDAGGIETTGYVSRFGQINNSGGTGTDSTTAAFGSFLNVASAATYFVTTLTLQNVAGFTWMATHVGEQGNGVNTIHGGGYKPLSAELTQVLIKSSAGDTFDAGVISLLYYS